MEFGLQWIFENFDAEQLIDATVIEADDPALEYESPFTEKRFIQIVDFLAIQLGVNPDSVVVDFQHESSYRLFHASELKSLEHTEAATADTDADANEDLQAESVEPPSATGNIMIDAATWIAGFTYLDKSFEHCPFGNVEEFNELLCLIHGLGPVIAKNALIEIPSLGNWYSDPMTLTAHEKLPLKFSILSTIDVGSVLGMLQFARREKGPAWARKLRPDVRRAMSKMVKYMERTQPFFGPESLGKQKCKANAMHFYDLLNSGREVDQLIAMNSMFVQLDVDQVDISDIYQLTFRSHPEVRRAATSALTRFVRLTQKTVHDDLRNRLLHLIDDRDNGVQAWAAFGLADLRLPESTIRSLCRMLHDSDRASALSASHALRHSSDFAHLIVPEVCEAIRVCLTRGDDESLWTLLDTLDEVADSPEEQLIEALDHNEHDFLFAATDALREVRKSKQNGE